MAPVTRSAKRTGTIATRIEKIAAPTSLRKCHTCDEKNPFAWALDNKKRDICKACKRYFGRNKEPRPAHIVERARLKLNRRRMAEESRIQNGEIIEEKKCKNCNKKTPGKVYQRQIANGQLLCEACVRFLNVHKVHRPLDPELCKIFSLKMRRATYEARRKRKETKAIAARNPSNNNGNVFESDEEEDMTVEEDADLNESEGSSGEDDKEEDEAEEIVRLLNEADANGSGASDGEDDEKDDGEDDGEDDEEDDGEEDEAEATVQMPNGADASQLKASDGDDNEGDGREDDGEKNEVEATVRVLNGTDANGSGEDNAAEAFQHNNGDMNAGADKMEVDAGPAENGDSLDKVESMEDVFEHQTENLQNDPLEPVNAENEVEPENGLVGDMVKLEIQEEMETGEEPRVDVDVPEKDVNGADLQHVKKEVIKQEVEEENEVLEEAVMEEFDYSSVFRDGDPNNFVFSGNEYDIPFIPHGKKDDRNGLRLLSLPFFFLEEDKVSWKGHIKSMSVFFAQIERIHLDFDNFELYLPNCKEKHLEREFVWLEDWTDSFKKKLADAYGMTFQSVSNWFNARKILEDQEGPLPAPSETDRMFKVQRFFDYRVPRQLYPRIGVRVGWDVDRVEEFFTRQQPNNL